MTKADTDVVLNTFAIFVDSYYSADMYNLHGPKQGRIQADAWKPRLQRDFFFKYGISPGLSEKKI